MWTAWGEDWVAQPAAQVADRVVGRALGPGDIVLLHDGLAGDPREPAAADPLHGVRDDIVAGLLRRFDRRRAAGDDGGRTSCRRAGPAAPPGSAPDTARTRWAPDRGTARVTAPR